MDTQDLNKTNRRHCVHASLRQSSRLITSFYADAMHDSVLQGTQFTLLSTIAAMPQCTVSTLSDYLVMDQTTVTRSVKLLEQAGFIQFKKLKDRRKRQLIVTAQGQQALDDAYPLWLAAQEHIWAHLSEDDIKQILTLGNKLAALSKESTIK